MKEVNLWVICQYREIIELDYSANLSVAILSSYEIAKAQINHHITNLFLVFPNKNTTINNTEPVWNIPYRRRTFSSLGNTLKNQHKTESWSNCGIDNLIKKLAMMFCFHIAHPFTVPNTVVKYTKTSLMWDMEHVFNADSFRCHTYLGILLWIALAFMCTVQLHYVGKYKYQITSFFCLAWLLMTPKWPLSKPTAPYLQDHLETSLLKYSSAE